MDGWSVPPVEAAERGRGLRIQGTAMLPGGQRWSAVASQVQRLPGASFVSKPGGSWGQWSFARRKRPSPAPRPPMPPPPPPRGEFLIYNPGKQRLPPPSPPFLPYFLPLVFSFPSPSCPLTLSFSFAFGVSLTQQALTALLWPGSWGHTENWEPTPVLRVERMTASMSPDQDRLQEL